MNLINKLIEIEAIKLDTKNLFTWASGIKSPIYCDNRMILSYPDIRNYVANQLVDLIKNEEVDIIAGVATGAISIATLVADRLDLPFIYVRTEAKSHGRKNQIEGVVDKNKKVIVIEDLISTGKSSINAVFALREQGLIVDKMFAIFTYNFDISNKVFTDNNVEIKTLANYQDLIEVAKKENYITESDMQFLSEWNKSI